MITVKDMERFGGVVVALFSYYYQEGTTMEQLRADAPEHYWIRLVLKQMEAMA